MKVTVKNVKFGPTSQETLNFACDVYIDGVYVGYAYNEGCGGMTSVRPHGDNWELVIAAEKHFATLPKYTPKGYDFQLQPSLDDTIDNIVNEMWDEKEKKKFLNKIGKLSTKNLVIVNKEMTEAWSVGWKGHNIEDMAHTPNGKAAITKALLQVKSKMKEGERIFNTNLKDLQYLVNQ